MKININYELMQEIDIANKGYSLNKCLIKNTKYCLKWALFWSVINMIFSKNHNPNILENTSFMLMLCPLFVGLDFAILPIHKEYKIQDADHNLRKLVSELNILNVKTSVSLLKDAELLIMLAKPLNDDGIFKNFDGTIIDITGYEFSKEAEVFQIYEPVRKILRNIAVPIADVSVVLSLPVCIYGKHGVEDLMQQTRSIFTFDEAERDVKKQKFVKIHFWQKSNIIQLFFVKHFLI